MLAQRNSYRDQSSEIGAGKLECPIPKLRKESYFQFAEGVDPKMDAAHLRWPPAPAPAARHVVPLHTSRSVQRLGGMKRCQPGSAVSV